MLFDEPQTAGCIVCGRGKSRGLKVEHVRLTTGHTVKLCDDCRKDPFRVSEAERRAVKA